MIRILLLLCTLLAGNGGPYRCAPAHAADQPPATAAATKPDPSNRWSGAWDARWQGGGARLDLAQNGSRVTGRYPLYDGNIIARATGNRLTGNWSQGTRSGSITLVLAPDGDSFMGRFDSGEWITGARTTTPAPTDMLDQSSPRAAFRSFIESGNAERAGNPDAGAAMAGVLDFGPADGALSREQRLATARALFALAELTTFRIASVPDPEEQADTVSLVLHQDGTGAALPLTLAPRHGKWWIIAPSEDAVKAARTALLARYGGQPPAADAYRRLGSARDTMRAFLEGMNDWNGGGRALALSTLDLSGIPEVARDYAAPLQAAYLKRVLDRVGFVTLEEIPDFAGAREPYVHFRHPSGRIAIGPVEEGGATRWKFTPDTVSRADELFEAMEDMPVAGDVPNEADELDYFTLRRWVHRHAPALRRDVGPLKTWQALGIVGLLGAVLAAGMVMGWLLVGVARMFVPATEKRRAIRLVWPLAVLAAMLLWQSLSPVLGLPTEVKSVTLPITGTIAALAAAVGGWRLIDVLGHRVLSGAWGTGTGMADIAISLMLAALRLVLLVTAVLTVADLLSLPTRGLVAGLGISGLAFAFASKETLSNVFGAAILVADRPFRRGDWISAGDVQGTVEHVGIRSTRVRTVEDSVVVVPNGKLSDATINNWGTRRHRLARARLLLAYGTTPEQIDALLDGLRALVEATPHTVTARTVVGVTGLGENGIELDLTTYLDVSSLTEERDVKHALMLDVLRIAQRLGLSLGVASVSATLPTVPPLAAE